MLGSAFGSGNELSVSELDAALNIMSLKRGKINDERYLMLDELLGYFAAKRLIIR